MLREAYYESPHVILVGKKKKINRQHWISKAGTQQSVCWRLVERHQVAADLSFDADSGLHIKMLGARPEGCGAPTGGKVIKT